MLADEVGAVHFADGLLLQQAEPAVDLGDHAGDGGLTGSRWTGEDQVVGALGYGQPALLAPDRHGHRAFQACDLILDLFEADEFGEFGLGLDEQVRLALLGAGVDEVGLPPARWRIPRVAARLDPRGGGGRHEPNDLSDNASSTPACSGLAAYSSASTSAASSSSP